MDQFVVSVKKKSYVKLSSCLKNILIHISKCHAVWIFHQRCRNIQAKFSRVQKVYRYTPSDDQKIQDCHHHRT
jgi:hypothetical protein